jgi:hypothetical protein
MGSAMSLRRALHLNQSVILRDLPGDNIPLLIDSSTPRLIHPLNPGLYLLTAL